MEGSVAVTLDPRSTLDVSGSRDPKLPTYVRPELLEVARDLDLVHDLLGGTRRMHDNSKKYIRKWTDEDASVYDIRAKSEEVMEGLGRALGAAVGMLFAQPPNVDWKNASEEFQSHADNIDGSGKSLKVFSKSFAEGCVRDGVGLILVDHPSPPTDEDGNRIPITFEMEQRLGLRPTWASYPRINILSWQTETLDNTETLTQIVLYEPTRIKDGLFGVKLSKRYRVLMLIDGKATWFLAEATKENPGEPDDFKVIESGFFANRNGVVANFLPVAVAHTGRSDAMMTATIPLLGVAWANLGHWRLSTNLRFYTDLCSFPQPTIIGKLAPEMKGTGSSQTQPGRLRIGPMVTVHLQGESEYKFTQPDTSAFEPLEKRVAQKERDMANMSFSFLAKDKRVQETAEAKQLDATAENATLATAAQGIDDCITKALEHHAWFLGEISNENEESPVFSINRDFESTMMDPAVMLAYISAVEKVGLPPRMLLEAWQDGGRIPPDADLDEILGEMMVAEAEKEAREAARLQLEADIAAGAIQEPAPVA